MSREQLSWTTYDSPIGRLTIVATAAGVCSVRFPERSPQPALGSQRPMPETERQFAGYFSGERQAFELRLDLRGPALDKLVWQRLLEIPYGTTTTYGELARLLDDAAYPPDIEPYMRARLVGAAVGRTPTPILVPCHRVIGADGSLTGYGGGLRRKRALLDLEGAGAQVRPSGAGKPSQARAQLQLI